MFNIKACSIVAGGAFLLSAVFGLIGGAGFFAILLRALIFAVLGFGFVAGAGVLIHQFLPELENPAGPYDSETAETIGDETSSLAERVGGTVDVSVGDEGEDLPGYALASEGEETVEPFLSPSGLDQGAEGGYTGAGEASVAAVAARPPELIGDVDVLPDLEGLSDSFVTPITVEDSGSRGGSHSSAASSPAQGSGGQFDAKEMAMAIQTILKRDQKG